MEYIVLHLKSYEFDFFKELSRLIQTPENAYGLSCIPNLPDPTFAHIRHEHTKFGLSVKEIHGRIALHILDIWYLQAKDKFHIIPMIMEIFRDLELYDECEEVIEMFPEMIEDGSRIKPTKLPVLELHNFPGIRHHLKDHYPQLLFSLCEQVNHNLQQNQRMLVG